MNGYVDPEEESVNSSGWKRPALFSPLE